MTKEDIRVLLRESLHREPDDELRDDARLALDSLTLVWIVHLLDERHGLAVDLDEEDQGDFDSVDGIHGYLRQRFPARVAAAEVPHGA
ncbi:hypothetical protein [Amycolatopsis ultiminotia]|uniref:hypothetical protein n=1 Tax=Amycolatopsis ultiminotia TaxID=543629 RepID=UPI0031EF7943